MSEQTEAELKTLSLKELRARGRKKCWSPSQKFWMEVSLYLTAPLARTNITPNQISVGWMAIQLVAAYLFLLGNYWYNVLAIFLFNFVAYIGDHMDGNLARMTKRFSNLGPYLEQLAIFFGTPFLFTGLAFGNYLNNANSSLSEESFIAKLWWIATTLRGNDETRTTVQSLIFSDSLQSTSDGSVTLFRIILP
jgi:hypothetical protein